MINQTMSATGHKFNPESMLENIGLTKGQTKVYLELLKMGEANARIICEKTGVKDSKIYTILKSLDLLGLTVTERTSPKTYRALPVDESLENIKALIDRQYKEKIHTLEALRTTLSPLYHTFPETTKYALILNGKQIIFNHIKLKLQSTTQEVIALFPSVNFLKEFENIFEELHESEVKIRIGVNFIPKMWKNKDIEDFKVKIEKMCCNVFFIVIDNNYLVSISSWENKYMYAIITSDINLINVMKSYLDNPSCRFNRNYVVILD